MGSRARKRIEDVRILRAAQFPEDNGPMSHPIRPEKYAAIDNFYTATVYNKGAEVIRMYETLLGRDGFRKGMDLYFERHDGNADANGRDLSQFERWYLQAGTPTLKASDSWDAETATYSLTLSQTVPDTPGQKDKLPMQIPVRVGLLDRESGKELMSDTVLELCEESKTFELKLEATCSSKPVPSLLRGFSAPVKLEYDYSDEDLSLLAGFDTDSFNRWEAMQRLGSKAQHTDAVLDAFKAEDIDSFEPDATFMDAMRRIVQDQEATPPIDPTRLHEARNRVRKVIAMNLEDDMRKRYDELTPEDDEKYVQNLVFLGNWKSCE
eukprot:Skav203246  [mRNA]  locus=scaffold2454:67823:72848:+ [translate_table: standard]